MARVVMIAYSRYLSDGRIRRHAEALAARGDHVDVIALTPEAGTCDGVNLVPVRISRYRGSSRLRYAHIYLAFFVRAAIQAFRLARLNGPYDLAIVSTMPDAVVFTALPLRLHRTRIVLDVHDTMPELYREKFGGKRGVIGARLLMFEERLSAGLADHVLAVHEPHRSRLIAAKIPRRKITSVINSPDPRLFTPFSRRRSDQFTLGWCGTIARRAGLDIGIEAVARLRERLSGIRLLVIGEGDDLGQVKEQVRRLHLEEVVRFAGMLPVNELPSMLGQVDLGLVLNRPSDATHLMLPVKLLEFAMLGIPVVAPRLRTIEHYFGDDAVKYYKAGDSTDLVDAIEGLYHAPQKCSVIAANARRTIDAFSWRVQCQEYFRVVDSLLPRPTQNVAATPAGRVVVDETT
jgi:glycosyltransferase involved in cell wall biosynthesis